MASVPQAARPGLDALAAELDDKQAKAATARGKLSDLGARLDAAGARARGSPQARQLDSAAGETLVRLREGIEAAARARESALAAAPSALGSEASQALAGRYSGTSPVEAALVRFIEQFRGAIFQRQKGKGLFAPGVSAVSPRVAAALAGAFDTPHGSIDPRGAANVDHLATVYEGVLARAAAERGRPLTQAEVDRLAIDTVLTDATGKGRSPEELATMELAPLVDTAGAALGGRGADFWKQALAAIPAYAKMPFMAGTLMHGIPAFATIGRAVRRAGLSDSTACDVYAAVLGHHMSGFIAGGFAKAAVRLDFEAMLARGDLSHECSMVLAELYESAIELAGKWRDRLDAAGRRTDGPPSLRPAEREEYAAAAARYRKAIEALPEHVCSQLINDDTQQFTPVGIPKWLGMMHVLAKPASNQALIEAVYRTAVQPYYEENIARGSGRAFYAATLRVAVRLGMRHVDDDAEWGCHFRAALPGEPEHQQLAWQLANDERLRDAYLRDRGLESFPELLPGADMVAWLRALPPDPAALGRMAATDLPPAPAVMR